MRSPQVKSPCLRGPLMMFPIEERNDSLYISDKEESKKRTHFFNNSLLSISRSSNQSEAGIVR